MNKKVEKENIINEFSQIEQASLYNDIRNASKSSSCKNRDVNNQNKLILTDIEK